MKINLPVTDHENTFAAGTTLVSRTDTKGIITFANDAFVQVSGFKREELIGNSHNIVRHPDMPAAAFEHMWNVLKSGMPWRGLVKNRCKNGDFYWVDAQVVPVRKNGVTIGYMSVRGAPARADVELAEAGLREAVRSKKPARPVALATWKNYISVKNGVIFGIVFVAMMMIAGGILGITGLTLSKYAMQKMYYNEMEPVQAVGRIKFLMADNRAKTVMALYTKSTQAETRSMGQTPGQELDAINNNRKEIEALWAGYSTHPRSTIERELAERYWTARNSFVEQGLKLAQQALAQGDFAQAETIIFKQVNPLYDQANESANVLLKYLSDTARANYMEVATRNEQISVVAVLGISIGLMISLFAGIFFFRATVLPLQAAVGALERIAEGNLSGTTTSAGYGEPGRVMTSVTVMQLHLKVMMDEIRQSASSIHAQCSRLNLTMMNLAQHAEEQHDRVYQALDNFSVSGAGMARLGDAAGAIVESAKALPPMVPAGAAEPAAEGTNAKPLAQMAQQLVAAIRIETFALEDSVGQMEQVTSLIVEARGEVQGAWAASQQLENTAQELDKLVKYFD